MLNTILFYDENAEKYAAQTSSANMSNVYERFEKYLASGAIVLDAGCGSGRDSVYFLNEGYSVVSMDASKELCKIASAAIGKSVINIKFQELDYENAFDAVWACASLLHLDVETLKDVLFRIHRSLKNSGVIYASWKYGDGIHTDGGRFYCDMTEEKIKSIVNQLNLFDFLEMWKSEDVLPNRTTQKWLNVIMRKMKA